MKHYMDDRQLKNFVFFKSILPELREKNLLKYVIIHDEKVIKISPTLKESLLNAIDQFGYAGDFIIQEIYEEGRFNFT